MSDDTEKRPIPAAELDAWREGVDKRLDRGSARMEAIEAALKENTAATLDGNRDAREILEIFQAVKGGIKVLGWIGTAARWVGGIAGLAAALIAAWHAFTHGPKP